jgi:glycosyltransferase involved in cell wall biosynthesis
VKFSIVTTSYNSGAYIGEAIESAWRQRGDVPAFEHIIADAASTDSTAAVLANYPHLDVDSRKDLGIYDGMNRAIARASGDIIVILNADDVLPDGALAAARRAFEATDTDIVVGGFKLRTGREEAAERVYAPGKAPSYTGLLFGIPAINARYIRRRVFENVGPFDLSYKLAADRAWLIHALAAGIASVAIRNALYVYRQHGGSATLSQTPESARKIYAQHVGVCPLLAHKADRDLGRAVRAFERMERLKLAIAEDLSSAPAISATSKALASARHLAWSLAAHPIETSRGLYDWRRYQGRHADN